MAYLILLFTQIFMTQGNTPVELGKVKWLRSMDEAIAMSRKECKPILILFQEIPGCQTCRQYGNEVLSHPLIVEAIETHFIPLAIYNNKGGDDAEILKKFNEPAWNNPVVRIVDDKGKDLIARLSGNYSAQGLASSITNVLIKNQGKAPLYLQLLSDELAAKSRGIQSSTYSMYCFWSGEALFGKVNGVITTSAGFQNGKEVVKVDYDPAIISKTQLDKIASQSSCKNSVAGNFSPDNTPKYYLSNSKYRSIPMSELQKCRVNSAIAEGQNPEIYLSPRQIQFLKKGGTDNLVSIDLINGWTMAEKSK
jgi:hypothetical protein